MISKYIYYFPYILLTLATNVNTKFNLINFLLVECDIIFTFLLNFTYIYIYIYIYIYLKLFKGEKEE